MVNWMMINASGVEGGATITRISEIVGKLTSRILLSEPIALALNSLP